MSGNSSRRNSHSGLSRCIASQELPSSIYQALFTAVLCSPYKGISSSFEVFDQRETGSLVHDEGTIVMRHREMKLSLHVSTNVAMVLPCVRERGEDAPLPTGGASDMQRVFRLDAASLSSRFLSIWFDSQWRCSVNNTLSVPFIQLRSLAAFCLLGGKQEGRPDMDWVRGISFFITALLFHIVSSIPTLTPLLPPMGSEDIYIENLRFLS